MGVLDENLLLWGVLEDSRDTCKEFESPEVDETG